MVRLVARTRWTPELLDQVRVMADAGCSMPHTASKLNVSLASLWSYASGHKIRFHSRTNPSADPQDIARAQLRSEIEAAKAEWGSAPPYKGGW